MKTHIQNTAINIILPDGWRIKGDYLITEDGDEKYILGDDKKINYSKLITCMSNYGYDNMAALVCSQQEHAALVAALEKIRGLDAKCAPHVQEAITIARETLAAVRVK